MTVNLTRIYTRLGDGGETHLGDMSRVPKTHPRIEAYGTVDELNAQIGVALTVPDLPERHAEWLRRIQNDLFDVGADISVPRGRRARAPARAARADRVARGGLRRGQRRPAAAEVLRAARRHARRRPPARLPHRLPPRRAARDRGRRRAQPRVRALPQPPLGPALHPLPRRQRAATSRCGSRAGTAERARSTPPSTAPCASCTPPRRQLGGHWARLAGRLGGAPATPLRDGAVRAARPLRRAGRRRPPSAACTASRPRRASARSSPGCATARATSCSSATRRCASRCSTPSTSRRCCSTSRRSPTAATTPRWPPSTAAGPSEIERARDAVRDAAIALAGDPERRRPPRRAVRARPRRPRRRQRGRHDGRGVRRLAARPRRAQAQLTATPRRSRTRTSSTGGGAAISCQPRETSS